MVRDIGDTTVQLSWSRGFDNHSPIAKYTLQARTPPAGKWKQVRTSKRPALSGWARPGCVPAVGAEAEGWAEPGASKGDKLGPSACRGLPGRWGDGGAWTAGA